MSVVVSDACGWLLDSHSFINEHYVCCLTKHGCSQQSAAYTFKREYFNIERPYIVSKPTENGETGQSMHDLKTPSAVQKVRRASLRKNDSPSVQDESAAIHSGIG